MRPRSPDCRSPLPAATGWARGSCLALALALLASCRAAVSDEELRAATLYFPPEFKYVEEPRFSFTAAERDFEWQ